MKNIMIFEINGQLFGYDTKFIKESVNINKIFVVPNAPHYIKGMFNLRNNPIPIVDTGLLLWNKELESDTVIVIEKNGKITSILIDKLKGVVQVNDENIKSSDTLTTLDSVSRKFIDNFFEKDGQIILILNLDVLFDVSKEKKVKNYQSATKERESINKGEVLEKYDGYIIFQIKNEWFSIEVNSVQEIISYPEEISPIPDNPEFVKGLFLLRNNSVILIDLPEYLQINDVSERERVIIVNINGNIYGISVPYVKEIKWIDRNKILEIKNDSVKNKGIISLDDGKRLVLILDIENLLSNNFSEISDRSSLEEKMSENIKDEKLTKYLNFKVGTVNMAIDIKDVQEVVEYHQINKLPKAPDYILGMMNLRNTVITVVSLEKKLNITDSNVALEDKRLIVLDGKSVSFLVDKLEGILSLNEKDISPPDESVDIEEKYLKGICKGKDNDLIFILDIENLLKKDEKYFNS